MGGEERSAPTVTVDGQLARRAADLPDEPALRHGDEVVSYGALEERVARAAGALQSLGLTPGTDEWPGDRVALMIGNTPRFVEVFYGILRAGLVAVPLNVGFTSAEVARILADADARALVVAAPPGERTGALAAHVAGLAGLEHVVVADVAAPAGPSAWEGLAAAAEPVPPADSAADAGGGGAPRTEDPAALATVQYTAGSTGEPKGAMLSHRALLANHRQLAVTTLRLEARDRVLCVLPLFHIFALNAVLAYGLGRGATVLLEERFDPLATLRLVERRRATVLAGAPPMFTAWADHEELEALDLSSVRAAVSGAAALPVEVQERFTGRTGIPVWQGYGLTETAPVLTTTAVGGVPKPGSVGRPLPDVELRLVDADGAPVRRGDPGEIRVRGPNVFDGYWRDAAATRAAVDEQGWFATGDIAYADDDGDLHLVDRKGDLIVVSGFNVYPGEVEAVLLRHPHVAGVAVVGVPDARTGEAVQAYVVPASGAEPDPDELRAFARRWLARFKVPEAVELVPELPLLPTGKVRREALRARAGGAPPT